jgi:transcriptional regulator with XRE-family HTH domain
VGWSDDGGSPVTRLVELRFLRGKTQRELALDMGLEQPSVSRIEVRNDPRLSQLELYVGALGATLTVRVRLPEGRTLVLELPDQEPPISR